MKKIFSIMTVAAALFTGYSTYKGQSSYELNDIALANVEALADSNIEDKFNCIIEKDECSHKIESEAQIPILKKYFPSMSLYVGLTVDLTNFTRVYREKRPEENGVRCGTDVTCFDLLTKLGI